MKKKVGNCKKVFGKSHSREEAARKCFLKLLFLKILQYSQKNTFTGVSFY